jgi:hypothetical protein
MNTVWTANSPRSKASRPCPGRGDISMLSLLNEMEASLVPFKCIVTHEHLRRPTLPGAIDLEIEDTGEKAYQRAFFLARKTRIKGSLLGDIDASWLDIEVPVVNSNISRRSCLDMIGMVKGVPSMIVELKDDRGQSPFQAIHEVLSYGQCASKNCLDLKSRARVTASGKSIDVSAYWPQYRGQYLVVGGPDDYWRRWENHFGVIAAAGVRWLADSELKGHHLMFVAYAGEDFKKQKGELAKYTPHALTCDWRVLFEARCPA